MNKKVITETRTSLLQKKPYYGLGLSQCQMALTTWLYSKYAITPHFGLSLFDISPKLSLNTLMANVLKQSYITNYQNELSLIPKNHYSKVPLGHFHLPHLPSTYNSLDVLISHQPGRVRLQSLTLATNVNHGLPSHGPLAISKFAFEKQKCKKQISAVVDQPLMQNTPFYCASWILYTLQQKLLLRNSNIKRVMQELFDHFDLLLAYKSNANQKMFKGLMVTISGRLSRSKQGMAKTVTKTIGTLPLSGLNQAVDYQMGHVVTKLGSVGIKVWVCYTNDA